jgi:hypothetical protein
MPFYHASRTVHPVGHVIVVPPGHDALAYQLSLQLGSKWRDDALEATRNGRASARQRAVYAANTPGNAAYFLMVQPNLENKPLRLYEVSLPHQSPSPMALIGYIDGRGTGFSALAACVEEYWTPTKDWEFLEYVVPAMTVVADLGVIDEMEIYTAQAAYENDRQRAREIWGRRE